MQLYSVASNSRVTLANPAANDYIDPISVVYIYERVTKGTYIAISSAGALREEMNTIGRVYYGSGFPAGLKLAAMVFGDGTVIKGEIPALAPSSLTLRVFK